MANGFSVAFLLPISGWLLYPFTLGLVASVNPCGFPLLPVYLTMFIDETAAGPDGVLRRMSRALLAGACATVGFIAVFGPLGLLSEEGFRGIYSTTASWARWVMVAVGAVLVALGVATLLGRHLALKLPHVRPGVGLRRPLAAGVFGVSYAIASLGCSLPLFLGGVAGSFTRSGTLRGVEDFLAYAVGMGLILTIVALAIAIAGPQAARALRPISRFVTPIGGIALMVVGAYLLLYWIGTIVNPTATTAPVRFVESLQGHIANWLQSEANLAGSVLALVCLLSAGIVLTVRRSHTESRLKN